MAHWLKAKRMSVFTSVAYGGNPAWVILGAEGVSDDALKLLASELNPLTDTAFVLPEATKEADILLRFFTGSGEINFSGHASVATYFALSGENILPLRGPKTTIRQRTKAGIQTVEIRTKGDKVARVTMTLTRPNYLDTEINNIQVARFLGLPPSEITDPNLPLDIISTGFYNLVVPVKSLNVMRNVIPNFPLMDSFCTRLGIQGVIVFCQEVLEPQDAAFMRHFAPSLGVNEDLISGAAAGSLGCYFIRNRIIEPKIFTRLVIEQGYLQNHKGKVYVHIECTREQILKVKVGGNAVLTFTGYIYSP